MHVKTTLFLLLLCAGLATYIFTVEHRLDSTLARQEKARRAFTVRADEIQALYIQQDPLTLKCVLDGPHWMIQEPITAQADASAIERILAKLERLARGTIITQREQQRLGLDLASYGLDDPAVVLSLEDRSHEPQVYEIGRLSAFGDAVYVRHRDTGDIVATDTNLLALLPASIDWLRDRRLLTMPPDRIRRIDLRNSSGFIQLARNNQGRWLLKQPLETRADPLLVNDLLERLAASKITLFVDDDVQDFTPYGCDPASAVMLTLAGPHEGETTLALGRPMETNTNLVYARIGRAPSVYGVSATIRQRAELRASELRNRRLTSWQPAEVQRLTIRQGEQTLVLTRKQDGWRLEQPRRWNADTTMVEAWVRQLCSARIEAFVDDPAAVLHMTPAFVFILEGRADRQGIRPSLTLRVDHDRSEQGWPRVAIDGEASLYEINDNSLPPPSLDPLDYRDRTVLQVKPDEVIRLAIVRGSIDQSAERDANGVFRCVEPIGFIPCQEDIQALLESCKALQAAHFVAEAPTDLAPYGLDEPTAIVSLGFQGGRGIGKTLLIGQTGDDGLTYVMIRGQDLVFTLDAVQRGRLTPVLCRPAL